MEKDTAGYRDFDLKPIVGGYNKLIEFLELYATNEILMNKDAQAIFSKDFTKFYDKAYERRDPNIDRMYHKKIINDALVEHSLGYHVTPVKGTGSDKSTHWKVSLNFPPCKWE